MDRYMVTHSLLNSWTYLLRDNPYSGNRDHMAEFMQTLKREPIAVNQAMQSGRDFEAMVTSILEDRDTPYPSWEEAGRAVATLIRGAKLQVKAHREIEVDGQRVFLYGRLDALKAGVVYDIKFTMGSYEAGKFIDSTQHPMYLALIPNATDFVYLVSNGRNVWPEHYTREETDDISPIIHNFYEWLNTQGLMETYKEYWKAKER